MKEHITRQIERLTLKMRHYHKNKFWFYEATVNNIVTVIEESIYIDELYVASKKYHRLLFINHHDTLIATRQDMPDKLR